MQTTAIDQEAGLIRLTTVLAHSSGEWLSSDWPVCPVSDTAAPHKMGAALTYARRYSLFTLVGIAGEDDLDAPDLPVIQLNGGFADLDPAEKMRGHAEAAAVPYVGPKENGSRRKITRDATPTPIPFPPDQSAALRDRLLGEVAGLQSADVAASWARDGITAKNSLAAADAKLVEEAFELRLSEFSQSETAEAPQGPWNCRNPDDHCKASCACYARKRCAQGYRQERAYGCRAASLSQQGASPVCRPTSLSRVRAETFRSPPPALHATACTRPKGQRRIRCPSMPDPSPGGSSCQR